MFPGGDLFQPVVMFGTQEEKLNPPGSTDNSREGIFMPLLTCPECGKELSLEAETCASCGADLRNKLIIAAGMGQPEIVGELLRAGADVNARAEDGCTALILACRQGHTDVVRTLLECGAEAEIMDGYGWTALMWAAASTGDPEATKLLLEHGADLETRDQYGATPLMKTCRR